MADTEVTAEVADATGAAPVAPTAEEAVTTEPKQKEQAEEVVSKEVSLSQQKNEARLVTNLVISRAIDRAKEKQRKLNSPIDGEESPAPLTEADQSFLSINALKTAGISVDENGEEVITELNYTTAENPYGRKIDSSKRPINVVTDEGTFIIRSIKRINGQDFTCMCSDAKRPTQQEEKIFKRNTIVEGQIRAEAEIIIPAITDKEGDVLALSMGMLEADADERNDIIESAAKSVGLITSESMISTIERFKKENPNLPPETSTDLDGLVNTLKKSNVVDKEAMVRIANIFLTDKVKKLLINQQARLSEGNNQAASNIGEQISMWNSLTSGENNLIERYFNKVEKGEVSEEGLRSINRLLVNGDVSNFLEELQTRIKNDPSLTPEEREEKTKMLNYYNETPGEGLVSLFGAIALEVLLEVGKSVVAGQKAA